MNLLYAFVAFLIALIFVLVGLTRVGTWLIERRNPPIGEFVDVGGARIHAVYRPAPAGDLPTLVFIHGASANLKDQMLPLRPQFDGRASMLFFDRPGYGWSQRGRGFETPEAQARLLAGLMDRFGIDKAIIVAHSFGGGAAAALALNHPQRVAGLVFVAATTHPWDGGRVSWYYELAGVPVLGWLFTESVTLPAGTLQMAAATQCVFAPNATPDNYLERASIRMVLRPASFRANATDVRSLYPFALANQPRYREIAAPTVVISGNHDTVVYEELHSIGLVRDIPGAELVWIDNLGHKPDWIAPDLIATAVEKLAGRPVDLTAAARAVEARIANDRHGEGICVDEKPAGGAELAPS